MRKLLTSLFLLLASNLALSQQTSGSLAFTADSPEEAMKQVEGVPEKFGQLAGNNKDVAILTMHGSNTVGESVGPELAKAYLTAKGATNVRLVKSTVENEKSVIGDLTDQGKTVRINIAAHGSSTGFKGLNGGKADVWASSRPVKQGEVETYKEKSNLLSPNSEHILGIDGLAIIVNSDNPLDSLTKQQLADIFSGAVKNWSEIGGHNAPVSIYARDDKSGTWDSFKSMVLSATNVSLSGLAKRFESSEQLSNNVSRDPGGIGFIGLAFVGKSKLLAIKDGESQAFKPNRLTVATEDYGLSRRLFLYTNDTPKNPYTHEFIRFAEGINGQKIVADNGFISQNVSSMQPDLSEGLPADYLQLVTGAERLSVNFRFTEGRSDLDNKAKTDVQRLVYYLKKNNLEKNLVLIGFGDSKKNEARSKLISKLRAMAVKRELKRFGIFPKETTGFGDANAVAALEGSSKTKNRRVEVWIQK